MRLYYSPGACSMAPHMVLEEIGKPYDLTKVMLAAGEHMTPEYGAVNKWRRVPALEVDGQILTEAGVIMTYLADNAPEKKLLPLVGSFERARALEWASWLASSVHIAFATIWRARRFLPEGFGDAELKATGVETVRTYFADIDKRIAGEFALQGGYSIIDPYLSVFYRWGNRIGLDMRASYPCWTAWAERIVERPAIKRVLELEGMNLWDKPS